MVCRVLTRIICCIMVPHFCHSQCLWVIWAVVLSGDVILFTTISLANCSEEPHHCFCKLVQPQQQGDMNLSFGLPSPAWEERQYLNLCQAVQAREELCLQTCDAHSCYICNLLVAKPFTRKEIWLLVWGMHSKNLLQFFFPENQQPGGRLYLVDGLQLSSHLMGVTEKYQPLMLSKIFWISQKLRKSVILPLPLLSWIVWTKIK